MADYIYHGAWINWSRGGIILGATLTTSNRSGGLLTSFIATFVTLVGVQLWKILAFALHQIRSTTEPQDGLHHQQQAIWRNSGGPGGTAWSFLQQAWFWRSKAKQSFLRTITWAIFATAYLVVFAVLAVFSSQISKSPGPQRLLVSDIDTCGYWTVDNNSTVAGRALASRQSNLSQIAHTYARACYGGVGNALTCSRYPKTAIAWSANKNATCPFQSGLCGYGDTAAFEMTSQLIDSQVDMGINTKPNERILMQKRTTCAPIRQSKYRVVDNNTRKNELGVEYDDPWIQLNFGGYYNATIGKYELNYTVQVAEHGVNCGTGYELETASWQVDLKTGDNYLGWLPVPELRRSNADTVLIFLKQNAIKYWDATFDPWFYANWTWPNHTTGLGAFGSSDYITTLGCAEQYRYCNPNNDQCTQFDGSLKGAYEILNDTVSPPPLGFNAMQQWVATRFTLSLQQASMGSLVTSLGAYALRAQQTVSDSSQTAALPVNQWQKELSGWFDMGLAALQGLVLEYPSGPAYVGSGGKLIQPAKNIKSGYWGQYLCNNQLINDSADTMSFSILGMGVLFVVGLVIIFTSFVVDRLVGFVQKCFRMNSYGQRAWMLDDKLQMQKAVFESMGKGRWKDSDLDSIPVTTIKGEFSRFETDRLLGPNTPDTPYVQTHFHESGPNQNDGPFNAPYYTEMEYMGPFSDDKKIPSTYTRSRQSSSSYLRSVT